MNRPPELPLSPEAQIEAIERSLRCFVGGVLSLLPGLGIFAAAYVFWVARRIRSRWPGRSNPAASYVNRGVWFACAGLVLTSLIAAFLIATAINHNSFIGCNYYGSGDE